ncbi:30S ribosomal protein S17e [Candidatus Pacearchaeota archaeon]|nr:30S ribosomal protein S17e [Candidatus Pacearchaeota archaeon]
MGKIKTKLIKRTARGLVKQGVNFNDKFEDNKTILGKSLPSKKIRNQVAGFLTRIKKEKQ